MGGHGRQTFGLGIYVAKERYCNDHHHHLTKPMVCLDGMPPNCNPRDHSSEGSLWLINFLKFHWNKIIMGNSTVIIWKMPIIILIYTISKFPKHHWNADGIRFTIMYHTVLYTVYSAYANQFNNIYPFR